MDIREIVVLAEPSDAGESCVALAAYLARQAAKGPDGIPAHVTGIGIIAEARDLPASSPIGDPIPDLGVPEDASREALFDTPAPPASGEAKFEGVPLSDLAEERFRSGVAGLLTDWRVIGHGRSDEFIGYARLADLAIVPQRDPEHGGKAFGIEPDDVLLGAGRPVLVVPYAGKFGAIGKRVIVAWDGSAQASRAMLDALPVIKGAEQVTVLTVALSERHWGMDRPSADAVVRYLGRHGILAFVDREAPEGQHISDVLLSRTADLGADLIVAGSYHHSKLREQLLGGVTRDVLFAMTVPVLTAH